MKAGTWGFIFGIALAVGLAIFFFVQYGRMVIHTAFAKEQINIFYMMKEQVQTATSYDDAKASLDYAMNYYPSGTKQEKGSQLDIMVEQVRQEVIDDIKEILQEKKEAEEAGT